jgi:hypothetical protein
MGYTDGVETVNKFTTVKLAQHIENVILRLEK